jgi:hypothetical protein
MNINSARIILTEMQICFKELDLSIMTESEVLNRSDNSNHLWFRSWLVKEKKIAEIVTYLSIDYDLVRLSLHYHGVWEGLIRPELFGFINSINELESSHYWIIHPGENNLEYRASYIVSETRFDREQFKSVLKRFSELGPWYFSYIKRLADNKKDPDQLYHQMKLELDDM